MNIYFKFHKETRLFMIAVAIVAISFESLFMWAFFDLMKHEYYIGAMIEFIIVSIIGYMVLFQILPDIRESFKEDKFFGKNNG